MRGRAIQLDVASCMEVVDAVQTAAEFYAWGEGLDRDRAHYLSIALREALVNAVQHAHHGDRRRRVRVYFSTDSRRNLVYTVRDRGGGFDLSRVPDPRLPENLNRGRGRGIFYMRQFADEVLFTFLKGGGVVVRLKKRLPSRRTRSRQVESVDGD